MGLLGSTIRGLIQLGMSFNSEERAYVEWRSSEEGKAYFDRVEDNAFWQALSRGDTHVIDTGIKEKQDRIRRLKQELGLPLILVCLMLSGCARYTIPQDRPTLAPEALMENERTYAVEDLQVKTPGGEKKTLEGKWHIVSPDFLRNHVRNQDDLIKTLKLLKQERAGRRRERWIWLVACIATTLLGVAIPGCLTRMRKGLETQLTHRHPPTH